MLKGADKLETNQLSNVLKNSNNTFEDFYNIITFKVNKVFKKLIGSNNIYVLQPAVLMGKAGMQLCLNTTGLFTLKKLILYTVFNTNR
jgi:hypothetical protein